MYDFFKRFGQQVCWVAGAGDVVHINDLIVDAFSDEMGTDVDVLHARV